MKNKKFFLFLLWVGVTTLAIQPSQPNIGEILLFATISFLVVLMTSMGVDKTNLANALALKTGALWAMFIALAILALATVVGLIFVSAIMMIYLPTIAWMVIYYILAIILGVLK